MIENYLEKIKQRLKVVVLHAVIYTRYSSDNQRSESIDAQIRLIRKWAQEHNIIIDKVKYNILAFNSNILCFMVRI